ncbi:MAG: sugar ABC transporter permease [Thermoprotei archaeon]|nr:MAG: sugar ABC transporter permease [Thermoprotei archaeon]
MKLSKIRYFLIFMGPILTITIIFYFMIGWCIYISMTDWRSARVSMKFVGLRNYFDVVQSREFYVSLINNIQWIALFMLPTTFLGLVIAYLIILTGKETIFRTIFLLPTAISMVVAGTLWVWMYATNGGINTLLRMIGLGSLARPWLSDPRTALYALIFVTVWQYLGFSIIVFEAAIKGIDRTLIEAAVVDGASGFQVFRYVILPQVRHGFLIAVPLLGLSALKVFDVVFVATRGGPGISTYVLAYYMWVKAFWWRFMADGAAIAVILLLLSLVLVIPYATYALRRWFG